MRATVAEIDANNIRYNINRIREKAPECTVIAMIKANAYGHGMINCAKVLRQENVEFLGVAMIDEAIQLRNSGDNGSIIILPSAQEDEAADFIKYNIHTTFSRFEVLKAFGEYSNSVQKKIDSHLFIDTGMNRDGFEPSDIPDILDIIKNYPYLNLIGICTHFASSDSEDLTFAEYQNNVFKESIKIAKANGFEPKYIHAANSAAIINLPDCQYNTIRPGISLYGYLGETFLLDKIDLKPILTLKTNVQLVKPLSKGETTGYSLRYIADKDTNLAVIPIGYGDGYFRGLFNRVQCLVNGKRYQSIGTICMDQLMIDIGSDDVKPGDEVVLIGNQGSEQITVYELSDLMNTIPYEITSSLTDRVPKKLINF